MMFKHRGECNALIALCDGEIAGHVFLYYKCRWVYAKGDIFLREMEHIMRKIYVS